VVRVILSMRAFMVIFLCGILTLSTTYSILMLFGEDSNGFFREMLH